MDEEHENKNVEANQVRPSENDEIVNKEQKVEFIRSRDEEIEKHTPIIPVRQEVKKETEKDIKSQEEKEAIIEEWIINYRMAMRIGDIEAAEIALGNAYKEDINNIKVKKLLEEFYKKYPKLLKKYIKNKREKKKKEKKVEVVEKPKLTPEQLRALGQWKVNIRNHLAWGEIERAEKAFKKAKQIDPKDKELVSMKRKIEIKKDRKAKREEYAKDQKELEEKYVEEKQKESVKITVGQKVEKLRQDLYNGKLGYKKGSRIAQKLIDENPDSIKPMVLLAEIFDMYKITTAATSMAEKALQNKNLSKEERQKLEQIKESVQAKENIRAKARFDNLYEKM